MGKDHCEPLQLETKDAIQKEQWFYLRTGLHKDKTVQEWDVAGLSGSDVEFRAENRFDPEVLRLLLEPDV